MRALHLTAHGGYDCLSFRDDVAIPTLGSTDVLVRLEGAAVNNTDVNTRVGWYSGGGWTGSFTFPRIQGIDGCGVVAAVGAEVAAGRIGERVLIEPCWREPGAPFGTAQFVGSEVDGCFAEYIAVPSRHAHRVQSSLTSIELATFPCSYSTALNMLLRASVQVGERALITGASGGVGSAAVQLAVALGAVVTAVASASKHEALIALGASSAIDREHVATIAAGSFDLVVDVVGGDRWPSLLTALRSGGRLVTAGAIESPTVQLDLRTLYLHDLTLIGSTVLDPHTFPALVNLIEAGSVQPVLAATYGLAEMRTAQERFLAKDFVGKIGISI